MLVCICCLLIAAPTFCSIVAVRANSEPSSLIDGIQDQHNELTYRHQPSVAQPTTSGQSFMANYIDANANNNANNNNNNNKDDIFTLGESIPPAIQFQRNHHRITYSHDSHQPHHERRHHRTRHSNRHHHHHQHYHDRHHPHAQSSDHFQEQATSHQVERQLQTSHLDDDDDDAGGGGGHYHIEPVSASPLSLLSSALQQEEQLIPTTSIATTIATTTAAAATLTTDDNIFKNSNYWSKRLHDNEIAVSKFESDLNDFSDIDVNNEDNDSNLYLISNNEEDEDVSVATFGNTDPKESLNYLQNIHDDDDLLLLRTNSVLQQQQHLESDLKQKQKQNNLIPGTEEYGRNRHKLTDTRHHHLFGHHDGHQNHRPRNPHFLSFHPHRFRHKQQQQQQTNSLQAKIKDFYKEDDHIDVGPTRKSEEIHHKVPEQLPIVVSSSDNSYVSASPLINTYDELLISTTAATTSSSGGGSGGGIGGGSGSSSGGRESGSSSGSARASSSSSSSGSSASSIDSNYNYNFDGSVGLDSLDSSTVTSGNIKTLHQHHQQQPAHYSNIVRNPKNEVNLRSTRRLWSSQHLASIEIEQEEPMNYEKGGLNSALIAVLFGVGATGMLIMVVGHKLRSIRRRVAYKGRRRSLVPEKTSDFLIQTIPI